MLLPFDFAATVSAQGALKLRKNYFLVLSGMIISKKLIVLRMSIGIAIG